MIVKCLISYSIIFCIFIVRRNQAPPNLPSDAAGSSFKTHKWEEENDEFDMCAIDSECQNVYRFRKKNMMATDGMLSLSWNNHKTTFCHILSTLREKASIHQWNYTSHFVFRLLCTVNDKNIISNPVTKE